MGKKNKKKNKIHQNHSVNDLDAKENLAARRLANENLKNIDKPRKPVNKAFIAQRDGAECPVCLIAISAGETVRYNPEGILVHHMHKKLEQVYEICNSCFLTKPCECED